MNERNNKDLSRKKWNGRRIEKEANKIKSYCIEKVNLGMCAYMCMLIGIKQRASHTLVNLANP